MSNQARAHHSHYLPWTLFFTIFFYLKSHGKDWALASPLHFSPFLTQAKPWLWHQTVVKSYFLVGLYTVSLFWPLLLRTPAVLGRQNCLAKMLLPLRSQVSVFGRPRQEFHTIAPRNRSQAQGESPAERLMLKTRALGAWRILAALLGLLFIPTLSCTAATADLRFCSQVWGLPVSDWQKQHWSLVCAFGNT